MKYYLLDSEPGVAEHADLIVDMRPVTGGSFFDQVISQLISHADDSVGHSLDFNKPER